MIDIILIILWFPFIVSISLVPLYMLLIIENSTISKISLAISSIVYLVILTLVAEYATYVGYEDTVLLMVFISPFLLIYGFFFMWMIPSFVHNFLLYILEDIEFKTKSLLAILSGTWAGVTYSGTILFITLKYLDLIM